MSEVPIAQPALSAGSAGAASPRAITAPGRSAGLVRLQAQVVGALANGVAVGLGGRVLLLEGAPPLAVGSPVTVLAPSQATPGEVNAGACLLIASDNGQVEVPIRIRPLDAPAVLAPRPAPAVAASLSLASEPARAVAVRLRLMPAMPAAFGASGPMADPSPGATVAALGGGAAFLACVLPRSPGGRVRLAIGGLEARLDHGAADLPEESTLAVRLDESDPATRQAASRLASLLAPDGQPERPAIARWAADARLGTRLADAAAALAGVPAGGERMTAVFLLGGADRPAPLRLLRDRDPRHDGARGNDAVVLAIEVTFGRLGRVRLEIGQDGRGELRLVLRSERPLPSEAGQELRGLVGAAFELRGRPACFLTAVGPWPAPRPRMSVAG